MSDHQSQQDRWLEEAYEQQRLEREAKKAAVAAEKARLKAHGIVPTIRTRRAQRWGSSALYTHRCPLCDKRVHMNTFSAVCTGRVIRKATP